MNAHSVQWVLLLAVVTAAVPSRAEAAEQPALPDLPVVVSMDDLRKVKPIDIGHDWTVRLGVSAADSDDADSRPPAEPWFLVYCLAEHKGPEREAALPLPAAPGGEPVGPVSVHVDWIEQEGRRAAVQRVLQAPQSFPREACFVYAVAAPWKGRPRVKVDGPDGKPIATATIDIPKPRRTYWQQFARLARRDEVGADVNTLVLDRPLAATPRFGAAGRSGLHGDANALGAGADRDIELPSPGGRTDGLRLSLEAGVFTVQCDRKLVDWPDEHLLARWWVNDRAVHAIPVADDEAFIAQARARMVGHRNRVAVAFGLPDHAGLLKPGDRVALQLLYAPGGHDALPDTPLPQQAQRMRALHEKGSALADELLLSNRLEFVMTEDLLKLADHPLPKKD